VEGTCGNDYVPGTIATVSSDNLVVVCGAGMLRVEKIKPEGKRVMTVHDFLLGSKIEEGTRFS
jgi:methionyl-tRNA formyltransferase